MPHLRIHEAADFLAVSTDTIRRMVDAGTLVAGEGDGGRRTVDAVSVAHHAREHLRALPDPVGRHTSARNRLVGIVTEVVTDTVMAQVELQCGPFRVVSLLSAEAVREMGLEPGVVAVAVIKSTQVVIETPDGRA
ncbi:TOBE domain-containing protein [Janibacter melonis]|uniref:TOBE domain-containing protein n=1 Tax=Janibacter melonis TaxID=262209 RepID=UPI00204377F3|nr:TOBE domain-containing protein [Janibacter melonis]MCM3555823.1 TOBE domain-containing protein [Janibacter melonis]